MLYKMNVFGCKEMLENFMNHVNDLLENKEYLRKVITVEKVDDNNILITHKSERKETSYFPIITFDRDTITTRTEDFIIDFGFEDKTVINGAFLESITASAVRDTMCSFLCGYEEFVDSKIVVSDEFEMKDFSSGCCLVIGSETNFTAKLDFIPSNFVNLS